MVTAELAVLVPFALAFVLLLVWLVSLGVAQVRLVDAAREGARAVARGTPVEEADALVRRLAPPGAEVTVRRGDDGTVEVEVTSRSRPLAPFAGTVGSAGLGATAVAALEDP